jgi:hypothetical protein
MLGLAKGTFLFSCRPKCASAHYLWKRYFGCLISQKKVSSTAFDRLGLCIGYVTAQTNVEAIHLNSPSYCEWLDAVERVEDRTPVRRERRGRLSTAAAPIQDAPDLLRGIRAEDQTAKPRVIQGKLAVELLSVPDCDLANIEYRTVGLHACGDLSITAHEIALNSRSSRGAISVPCCYQHLSERRLPLLPENQVLCDAFFAGNDEKRHNFLKYAVYEYKTDFEVHRQSCDGFKARVIADCFLPPRTSLKKLPQRDAESFVDYILRVAARFERNPTAEEVSAKVEECEANAWKMMAHTLVRERFGHVFETFLLIERLAYFARLVKQQSGRFLIGMFDVFTHLSPRGFSLFTIRLQ